MNTVQQIIRQPIQALILLISIALISIALISADANASVIHGFVYTRNIVTNEAGNYTWGEYDPQTGSYIRDIGEATADLNPSEWRVMSGDEYRGIVSQKNTLHQAQPDLVLMSRADYLAASILLADGTPIASKPGLGRATAYVSILPQARRLVDDPASLILAEYPINPDVAIGDDILSMLHGYGGAVLGETKLATTNRIGFKVAFAQDDAGNPVPIDKGVEISGGNEYDAVGPIQNALIEGWQSKTASGSNGAFALYPYTIPCPGFYYAIDSTISVELRYRRFNPRAQGRTGLYMDTYPSSVICRSSFFMVPILGPFPLGWSTTTYPDHAIQFAIDLTVLSGTAQLSKDVTATATRVGLSGNKVPIGGNTQYLAETPDNSATVITDYDFDRDGTLDTLLTGHYEDDGQGNQIFVATAPEDLQGVWLSSGGITPATGQPDFTRVLDSASYADHSHQGLLSAISAEDLRNTDIYVVRVSDGKLISERIGLNEYEANRISAFGEDAGNSQFFYTIQMQGGTGDKRFSYNFFDDWQSHSGINPDLHQRQSDHLQPGDVIRIYAINRATGYIGHVDTVMQAGTLSSGDLSFHIDPIIMGPPNLKVRAERGYKIKSGATATDETITQLIGFEGASLTSDNTVTITTEWLDHDGRPMPESLAGAGYTGRIAILSGDKTLSSDNQGVYQFSIHPGRRLQVLQLPNALTDREHFYIHISGEPQSGNPIFAGTTDSVRLREADFSSSGQNPGILAKRPDNYVPFLVPIYDEAASELQTQALFTLRQQNPGQIYETPDPIYRWVYRPEMQFTSYDLTVSEINKSRDDDTSGMIEPGETINIINDDAPLITSDAAVGLLYGLSTTDLLPLDYFSAGADKELVFAIGEREVKASLSANGSITFNDLAHLDQLSPDDFISIRLYANNDMGNTLWEWAFLAPSSYRVREADNRCNAAPNRKQIETGYGKTLIVVYEPEDPGSVEILLDKVDAESLEGDIQYRVYGAGGWRDVVATRDNAKEEIKLKFPIANNNSDDVYKVYYYLDENKNGAYDQSEITDLLKYRKGELIILAASVTSYQTHETNLLDDINFYAGPNGSAHDLYEYFMAGATSPTGTLSLVYKQEEVGTVADTLKNDYLVNAWVHGAGVNLVWSSLPDDTEFCTSEMPFYTHTANMPLNDKVLNSGDFHNALESIVSFNSFSNDKASAIACTDGSVCEQFSTNDLDVDVNFSSVLPGSAAADLFAAIGASKMKYTAKVRYKDGLITDSYDIKITGEIYDMYDYNYGRKNFGLDFNSDGAIIELGYEQARTKGGVFVTIVPFEVFYNVSCGILDCNYNSSMDFSAVGDF